MLKSAFVWVNRQLSLADRSEDIKRDREGFLIAHKFRPKSGVINSGCERKIDLYLERSDFLQNIDCRAACILQNPTIKVRIAQKSVRNVALKRMKKLAMGHI